MNTSKCVPFLLWLRIDHHTKSRSHPEPLRPVFPPPPARIRVEVIKGGGTQQAKNAIQQQLLTRRADSSSCSVDDASLSSVAPQDPEPPTPTLTKHNTTTRGASNPKPSTTHDGHEHKMAKSSLLRFYQQDRGDGGGTTGAGASATAATTSDATALAAAPGKVSSVAVSTPSAPTASDTAGLMPQGTASTATSAGGAELGRKLLPAGGGSSEQSHRPQTRPAAGAAGGSCSSSTIANAEHGRERRRRRRGKGEALPGEDVRRLLLRAMVGYDWVDEFNSKDVRVRGAFTEQDVVVLEVCGPVRRGDRGGTRYHACLSLKIMYFIHPRTGRSYEDFTGPGSNRT